MDGFIWFCVRIAVDASLGEWLRGLLFPGNFPRPVSSLPAPLFLMPCLVKQGVWEAGHENMDV